MDSLESAGIAVLHLDLGDFISTQKVVAEQRSRYLFEEMARLGVKATTPGRRELSEWLLFESLLESGEIPFVSSNLYRGSGAEKHPLTNRYLLEDVAGIRFGIVGLIGAEDFGRARVPDSAELSFQDPAEALRELLPELETKAEVIVLLSQIGREDTATLLHEVPGVDVALIGNRARADDEIVMEGETVTNQSGVRGQWAGILSLIVDPTGDIVEAEAHNRSLDKLVPKDPDVLLRAQEADAESNRLKQDDLLAQKQERAAKEGSTRYLGAETCKRCHVSEYEQWRETPHAKAFMTLKEDLGGLKDAEACIGCHVTGFEATGGWVSANTSPDLRNVQCEACHGPGTEHVRTGGNAKMGEAVCTTCHSGEFAKDWNFPKYYELVRHK
ncbi:MAG: multiheme c-type cytochrome [Candidatus Eisenbacteria bacterium]